MRKQTKRAMYLSFGTDNTTNDTGGIGGHADIGVVHLREERSTEFEHFWHKFQVKPHAFSSRSYQNVVQQAKPKVDYVNDLSERGVQAALSIECEIIMSNVWNLIFVCFYKS